MIQKMNILMIRISALMKRKLRISDSSITMNFTQTTYVLNIQDTFRQKDRNSGVILMLLYGMTKTWMLIIRLLMIQDGL